MVQGHTPSLPKRSKYCPSNWEKQAVGHPSWRSAVKRGATQYEEERIIHAQINRRVRKAHKDMLQDLNQFDAVSTL